MVNPGRSRRPSLGGLSVFDRADVLSPGVMMSVWAAVTSRPGVSPATIAAAKAGEYGASATRAREDGDRALAASLDGVASFSAGRFDAAALQFQGATRIDQTFVPERFLFGAALAGLDRHREAAGLIQSGSTTAAPVAPISRLAGEEWIKASLPQLAVAPLQLALQHPGTDARARKLLGIAYVLARRPADAVAVLTPYLADHPSDQPATAGGPLRRVRPAS